MSVSPSSDAKIDTDEGPQKVLRLRWDADGNNSNDEEECTVSIARLRQHCSSELARTLRRQLGTLTGVEKPDPTPVLWGKGVLSSTAGSNPARYEYKAIMKDDQQSSPASSSSFSSQTAACQLRGRLKSHGIALVRGVPTDPAATEALGQKVAGHLMGTVFGKTVWGLSPENHDTDAFYRDSSYSTDALPMHTDYPYGSETPGLLVSHVSTLSMRVLHLASLLNLGWVETCGKYFLLSSNWHGSERAAGGQGPTGEWARCTNSCGTVEV